MFTTTTTSFDARPLIFVALLLICDKVHGVLITVLSRRHSSDKGSDDPAPSSTQSTTSTSSSSTVTPITSSSLSNTSSLPTSTSSLRSTSSPSSSLSRSTSSLSSSTSSPLPTSTLNVQARLADARHVGTIVGAVVGSVILAGLALMVLTRYLRRIRKARKRPRGSTYFAEQPLPQTEMSQTQSSSLLVSPASLVHHPVPRQFFNPTPSDSSSLSLLPAATFPTHDIALPLPEKAVLAGSPLSTSGQPSPLHRDMADFQKALNGDHKGEMSDQPTNIGDPPPKYTG